MDRRIGRHHRWHLPTRMFMTVLLGSVALASCGASSGATATKACKTVEASIALYKSSLSKPSTSTAKAEQTKSLLMLRNALPEAAIAAGSNGEYQALQATLSETNRVPERLLIPALSRQCATILPSNSILAVPGGYVPPANIKANPAK